jgi:hypothetical protein
MKFIAKTFIVSALLLNSISARASTGETNCQVVALYALEGDSNQYAKINCESGQIPQFQESCRMS